MKSKKKVSKVTIILMFFFYSYGFSQIIEGKITDQSTGEPLVGAAVLIKNTNTGCVSDFQGYYTIDISKIDFDKIEIIVSFLGFNDFEQQVFIKNNKDIKFNILLEESLFNLDQVVVTGTRTKRLLKNTPVTTQVVSFKQIQNVGGADISEALKEVTGVVIQSNSFNNGVSSIELQGLNSEHILVLVDGMKMIGRVNGELDISRISPSDIERIEIVKGAASALYGSEAMGGVINIITKKQSDEFSLSAGSTVGSYGRFDGNVTAGMALGKWKPSVNLNYRKYDGFDLNDESASEDAPAYQKYQGNFSLDGEINEDFLLNLETFYIKELNEVVSSSIFKDEINNNTSAVRLKGVYSNLFDRLNLDGRVEFSSYNHQFDRIVLESGYLKESSLTKEKLFKTDLLFDLNLDAHLINGGFGIENEKIITDRIKEGEKSSTLFYTFIQDEIDVTKWLTVVGGLRFDSHSVYGSELSPKLSVMAKTGETSRVRASYGHGFRAPSFKELYLDYTNISVNYHVIGNPDLDPEKSNALQLSFETWKTKKYQSQINLFYNKINNLIDYKYLGIIDGFGTYQSTNLHSAKTWGVEFDFKYYPLKWLQFSFGYNYLNTWNAATEDEMTFKPKHRLNSSVSFNLPWSITWNVRAQYIGKKFYWEDFDDATMTGTKAWIDDYFLLHTNVNIPIKWGLKSNIGIKNITNYYDKNWGPMPGIEWYAGLNYNL